MVDERQAEAGADHRQTLTSEKPCCTAVTKLGKPCKGRPEADGYCRVHSPTSTFNPAEAGRRGGKKSAAVKRARRESRARELRTATDLLREEFATDAEWRAAVRAAYRDPVMHSSKATERLAAAEALVNRIDGKPVQNIQAKHEVNITVVSRLGAALERAAQADVDLPAGDVTEIEAD